jgi:hypothetical protein
MTMLDHQATDSWTGVHEDFVLTVENPYERIFSRQREQDTHTTPVPARDPQDLRANLLSGLAAVMITVALFTGGIVTLASPALARPATVMLL